MASLPIKQSIIFIIGHFPGCGGVEKVTSELAAKFADEGYHVIICSFFGEPDTSSTYKFTFASSIRHRRLKFPILSLSNFRALYRIASSNQHSVIINQWCLPLNLSLLLMAVKKLTGAKLISCHHNNPVTNAKIVAICDMLDNVPYTTRFLYVIKLKIVKLLTRISLIFSIFSSDKFILLSDSFTSSLLAFIGWRESPKIVSIPNPVSLPNTLIASEPFSQSLKEDIITYVGRIDSNQKRVERIIELWESIHSSIPSWSLWIIGDGPLKISLEQYVLSRALKNVHFVGFANPHPYLERSKINLLLSEWEGFGLVNVEAMGHGCVPVCLNSYAAAQEIITHNHNGILLPYPYSIHQASSEIINLARDPKHRQTLASNGLKAALNYHIDTVFLLWTDLLASLTKDN